jgi:hypothetical protein
MTITAIFLTTIVGIVVLLATCTIAQAMAQLSGHKTTVENPACLNLFGLTGKCPPSKIDVDLGVNISGFQMAHNGG